MIKKNEWNIIFGLRDEFFKKYFDRNPYGYQVEISNKIIKAVLLDTGETIAIMQSRQSGKTCGISMTVAFLQATYFQLKIILNLYMPTDFNTGIFAPQQEQAKTDFSNIKNYLNSITKKSKDISRDFVVGESNGNTLTLISDKYPSRTTFCFSASPTSNTESKTLHLIILEEAHMLLDSKIDNTIMPMGVQTNAVTVYIGTAGYTKCKFYHTLNNLPDSQKIIVDYERAIKERKQKYKETKDKVHLNYEKKIDQIKRETGVNSDAFKTQYALKWVLERGQFTTEEALAKLEIKQDLPEYIGKGEVCYGGIDWGKQNDNTVLTIVDDKYNIRKWIEIPGDDYNSQILMIVAIIQKYFKGCRTIHCDSTGNQDQAVDVLRGRFRENNMYVNVIPVPMSAQRKDVMYKHLWSLMHDKKIGDMIVEPAKLTYPSKNCIEKEKFILQMLNLQKEMTYNGLWSCHHPEGNYHDDFCFVAGTKVLTDKGQVSIEKLKIGDMVMTRQGFKPITMIGNRKEKVITKLGLTGTLDHPIILKDRIEKLINVAVSDIIYIWNEKLLSIMEYPITDIQILKEGILENIIGHIQNGKNHQNHYTDKYGEIITEKYKKGILSIIKTIIQEITKLKILKLCHVENINQNTVKQKKEKENQELILKNMQDLKLQYGMDQKKEKNGIENIFMKVWQKLKKVNMNVFIVKNFFMQKILKQNIVQTVALKNNIELNILKLDNVNIVKKNLKLTSIQELDFVHQNVQQQVIEEKRVYNISVKDCNEYFANNILVHNCDSVSLAFLAFGGFMKKYRPTIA